MTIKDIARESGYAVGTVSRALNNAPGVSAETRQKILEIVNRHNYEPNANAKHLKQQTNDGIALIVKGTQNMLFAGILEPLQQIIEESGYVATVYYIDEEANEVAQARRICTERKPHGILFLGSTGILHAGVGGTRYPLPAADEQRWHPCASAICPVCP